MLLNVLAHELQAAARASALDEGPFYRGGRRASPLPVPYATVAMISGTGLLASAIPRHPSAGDRPQ